MMTIMTTTLFMLSLPVLSPCILTPGAVCWRDILGVMTHAATTVASHHLWPDPPR
jgi:hypothetical protein